MRKNFNLFVSHFGFDGSQDFVNSLIHTKLTWISIPLTGVGIILEKYLGLQTLTLLAFGTLIVLELFTGILSARIQGRKIQSKKFSRFGLKMSVWIILFFILNSMRLQYEAKGGITYEFYDWMHTFLLGFVNTEYLLSVLENIGIISGKSNNNLISAIRNKFFQISGIDSAKEKEEPKKEVPINPNLN